MLELDNIRKSFGATQALKGVSLKANAGRVLGLVGENGAGKSTLMKVLSGAIDPDGGTMRLAGEPYAPRGPLDARRAGVAMIYQELTLAPDLSIEDNIMLGQERQRAGWLKRSEQRPLIREALARLGHGDIDLSRPVRELSVGLQQVVEIARALVSQARLIVFDEPTSSLTHADVDQLMQVISRLRDSGLAIIYISHFLEEVRRLCDDYAVLRDGASVGAGSLAGISNDGIVQLMVGREVEDLFPHVPHQPGETVLRLQGVSGHDMPSDVSLELRRGEIFGLAGLVGSGRTPLLRCVMGLDPTMSGTIELNGQPVRGSVEQRIRLGLGLVSENRKEEGLALTRSIEDNLTYSALGRYSRVGWMNLSQRRESARSLMQRLSVKARAPGQAVGELSGGNQQKVAIARLLDQEAQVWLLDEPTRGIDVGTKSEIYRLMGELAAAGRTVVFVSSYLTELLAVCDRVGVMARGQLKSVRDARDWTQESLMQVAVG